MISLKDLVVRRYTQELEENSDKTVYDLFLWKKVSVKLKDYKTGKVLFKREDLEFPSHYSQQACDIIAEKYFKRANVPNELGYEYSMREVTHRIIKFLVESAMEENLLTESEGKIVYDELAYMMLSQFFAFNSPQWFNTGLKYYQTGEKADGHYYYDKELCKVVESEDKYSRTQASACFILGIEDKLLGDKSISQQYETETRLFKHGSGTGSNFSTIRAKGEKLSGGGHSSGVMSFLKGFDKNAGTIKSGGTLRRSAKMNQLDADHPDILDYVTWKAKEEDKVRALGKMGYDTSFEGEAYETVSGQNANNTVRFSDEFMKKAKELNSDGIDSTFMLRGRVDSSIDKEIKVSTLWDTFVDSAWKCSDPAPAFDDTFNAWHTCPCGEDGKYMAKHNRINSTNPCGEYAFLDDTACNLASINIMKFYDVEHDVFDVEGYKHCIALVQLMLEAAINWGHFPTEDVARRSYMFRTTGLGIANLGGLLMMMALPYDSDKARNLSAAIVSLLTGYSYLTSSLMAERIGAFAKYNVNREHMLRVITNHARVSGALSCDYEGLNYEPMELDHEVLCELGLSYLSSEVVQTWSNALISGKKHGYRNAQVSVIAPTGTISFAMDCSSTSIEPYFSHVVYKKVVGGQVMEMVNPLLPIALQRLGYKELEIEEIMEYILRKETIQEGDFSYEVIADGKIEGCPHLLEEHLPIFDTANKCGTGERYIRPMGHVLMMAALTPHISGAISKTVNLPKNITKQEISDIFIKSWELGVKGITVYRDGSKASQPLNSTKESSHKDIHDYTYEELLNEVILLKTNTKVKRERVEGIRYGTTHPAQIEDVKIYTTVNRRENGEICEVYITTDREGSIITGLLNSLSKSISVMLQHHVPPKDIANMFKGQQYEPNGFVDRHPYIKYTDSISDLISRILEIELGDYTRCQVKPNCDCEVNLNTSKFLEEIEGAWGKKEDIKESKKTKGTKVYGQTCTNCGSSNLVQNGTCKICTECGTTTGCS